MTVERSFRGLRYYEDERDEGAWRYWPQGVEPERAPNGRPTLSLLVTGPGATLQLGTRWSAAEDALEELRAHLAGPDGDATSVRLEPAPADVETAVLEVGDGTGTFAELARAATSGFGPQQVVFSAALDAENKNRASNALAGRTGWLRVRYEGVLERPAAAEGRLTGDPRRLEDDRTDPRAAVEAALEDGSLAARVRGDEELREQVLALLVEEAAAATGSVGAGGGTAEIDIWVGVGAVRRVPLDVGADVGDWFADGSGTGHVMNLATGT